jgi:EAL domain-containing protein (putative c-di-GMP-specific phosphodiesterase class I)/DNA-binding response OmpR family regulator
MRRTATGPVTDTYPPPTPSLVVSDEIAALTILLVDDRQSNLDSLRRLLHRARLRSVVTARNASAAIEQCASAAPDLVVLDWHIPGVHGRDLLAAIRRAVREDDLVPILVLTADPTYATRHDALRGGATDFLSKPVAPDEVILRIRNLLEARATHRRLLARQMALESAVEAQNAHVEEDAASRAELEQRLHVALNGDLLSMVFQAIVDIGDGSVIGAEALSRFASTPYRAPNIWFKEAFSIGHGVALELRAVQLALSQLADLPNSAHMSINVSADTLVDPLLQRLLEDCVDPTRVILELTEHAPVTHVDAAVDAIARFRQWGIRLAIDDAGAGYAGLQRMLELQPDIIKLDRDLIGGIDHHDARQSLVRSQVGYATEVGAVLVAEGVETLDELTTLRSLGVPWAQGYLFAKPTPLPISHHSFPPST